MVAVTTDIVREGKAVVGYGLASVARFAQGGLMRERFMPRLLNAPDGALIDEEGMNLDPFRAWETMMTGEKPGGHGERCVAVGALDMAIWDAAAKIAKLPLYHYLARRLGRKATTEIGARVRVYGAGGYVYPEDDIARLSEEVHRFAELGFTHVKIKIGSVGLSQDRKRIEAAAKQLPGGAAHLAVDAIYAYNAKTAPTAASMLAPFALWWFEDICDPLDFETQAASSPTTQVRLPRVRRSSRWRKRHRRLISSRDCATARDRLSLAQSPAWAFGPDPTFSGAYLGPITASLHARSNCDHRSAASLGMSMVHHRNSVRAG